MKGVVKTTVMLTLPVIFLACLPTALQFRGPETERHGYGTKPAIPVLESLANYSGRTSSRIIGQWHEGSSSVTTEFLPNGKWQRIANDGKIISSGTYTFTNEHSMVMNPTMMMNPVPYPYGVYVGVNTMTMILRPGQSDEIISKLARSTSKIPF